MGAELENDNLPVIKYLMRKAREAEEAAEEALGRVRYLEGHQTLRKAYAQDRLERLEAAIRALARRVKALEEALTRGREEDRARRLEMAKAMLEELTPRVFAKRGGDADVLVAADRTREALARARLEEVEPLLARWKAEVGGR